jgi:hypothetical protein
VVEAIEGAAGRGDDGSFTPIKKTIEINLEVSKI